MIRNEESSKFSSQPSEMLRAVVAATVGDDGSRQTRWPGRRRPRRPPPHHHCSPALCRLRAAAALPLAAHDATSLIVIPSEQPKSADVDGLAWSGSGGGDRVSDGDGSDSWCGVGGMWRRQWRLSIPLAKSRQGPVLISCAGGAAPGEKAGLGLVSSSPSPGLLNAGEIWGPCQR